jgi:environmental stress-induced protein Ves
VTREAPGIVRLRDCPSVPWLNGGGTTRLLWSDADGQGGFDRRISIATIKAPGPFTLLPGVDRSLLLFDGDGLELEVDGRRLSLQRAVPFVFSGEQAVHVPAGQAPARLLNVMTRRARWTHWLRCGDEGAADADCHVLLTDGPAGHGMEAGDMVTTAEGLAVAHIGFQPRDLS